jgi:hypothetical protein
MEMHEVAQAYGPIYRVDVVAANLQVRHKDIPDPVRHLLVNFQANDKSEVAPP